MGNVEIVYVPIGQNPLHIHIVFAAGMTVAMALEQSGLFITHPETVDLSVGIFARMVALDTVVKSGDRIEIYRPLLISPMETRRQRAKRK